MPKSAAPRARLCLVTPPTIDPAAFSGVLKSALAAGDIATLFIDARDRDDDRQRTTEALVPIAQAAGVAALVVNDTRLLGRANADGVHIDTGLADLTAALDRYRGKKIVGAGGIRSRHEAMELGEREPDYLFFGRLDGDTGDGIFPKAFDLASWWSGLFEIPAIVMGGRALESVTAAAEAGIEFVALRDAVWDHADSPAAAVAEANRLLAVAVPA
jgi:thiamine-phosphate pyrophosphorylase